MSLCFTSASNGGLRSVVVHISTLWPVCFLGRWIKEAMGWGRCCCLRERMKRRFITPQHHGARTHTQSQSGLVISSSPSSGGSERLQAPLSDHRQLPLHSSRMRSDTWMHMPLAPNTYECPAFIWRCRNSRATVTVGDGGAVLGGLLLPGHGSTEHFHWKITLRLGGWGRGDTPTPWT